MVLNKKQIRSLVEAEAHAYVYGKYDVYVYYNPATKMFDWGKREWARATGFDLVEIAPIERGCFGDFEPYDNEALSIKEIKYVIRTCFLHDTVIWVEQKLTELGY